MARNGKLALYTHSVNKRTLVGYGKAISGEAIPLDTDLGIAMQDGTLKYPMAISTDKPTAVRDAGTPHWIRLYEHDDPTVARQVALKTGIIVPIQFVMICSCVGIAPRGVDIRTVTIYYR